MLYSVLHCSEGGETAVRGREGTSLWGDGGQFGVTVTVFNKQRRI